MGLLLLILVIFLLFGGGGYYGYRSGYYGGAHYGGGLGLVLLIVVLVLLFGGGGYWHYYRRDGRSLMREWPASCRPFVFRRGFANGKGKQNDHIQRAARHHGHR